ncbi:hypothetical protein [Paracoccus jeotgali]|uniref:hypothetical protein n=1 Tax=Paracoccus jeotgali TaxID=2065379 RepID=UPI0028A61E14|nr:hypothetical protein [Paracoccus jeotgali]
MSFPDFYGSVPAIAMRDPLAGFLNAARGGVIVYNYSDAVKVAGHSCVVTAAAWAMLLAGLSALYGTDLPERGGLEVQFCDAAEEGTTGVTASIVQLVTGASGASGFHGIGPTARFSRRGLMRFSTAIEGNLGLRRSDTGKGVVVASDVSMVPMSAELRDLFPRAVAGELDDASLTKFGQLWQDRIRSLLLDHAGDVVSVKEWI